MLTLSEVLFTARNRAATKEAREVLDKFQGSNLRHLFDPYKSGYKATTIEEKAKVLRVFVRNGIPMTLLHGLYVRHHEATGRKDVAAEFTEGLAKITDHLLLHTSNRRGWRGAYEQE